MEIDFFVAVPGEEAGEAIAKRARSLGFATSVEQSAKTGEWTCYCTKTIVPSYENVVAIERQLDSVARARGGYSDGFGSYGNVTAAS
jgi:hypothetical protein